MNSLLKFQMNSGHPQNCLSANLILFSFAEVRKRRIESGSGSTSSSSKISASHIEQVIENLKFNQVRLSTRNMYLHVWKQFNSFLIKLDFRPKQWEDRLVLYLGHLVETGAKSSTLKSYISAVKNVVIADDYDWDDNKVVLSAIVRGCRIKNDVQKMRLPIHFGLFELLLFELDRYYGISQPYLQLLFRALFCPLYYGLMRISEVADIDHTLLAKNVHVGENKNKILLVLYSSKTHGHEAMLQKIKISEISFLHPAQFFCPFCAMRNYINARGTYTTENEKFFVLTDRSPVTPAMVRTGCTVTA